MKRGWRLKYANQSSLAGPPELDGVRLALIMLICEGARRGRERVIDGWHPVGPVRYCAKKG